MGLKEVLVGVARAGDWDDVGWRGPTRTGLGAVRRIAEGAGNPPRGPARSGRAGRDRPGRPAGNHHRRGPADQGAGVGGARAGGGPTRSCGARRLVYSGGARPPIPLICQYIDERKEEFGARAGSARRRPAPVPGSPRAPAWARRSRPPSARSARDDALRSEIGRVHRRRLLGVRGPQDARRAGPPRDRRAPRGRSRGGGAPPVRLMRDMGLHGMRRAKSPRTTRSAPEGGSARPTR